MEGVFSEAQMMLLDYSVSHSSSLTPEAIAKSIDYLRVNECDSNIIIQGQNGIGKTMSLMAHGLALGDTPETILDEFVYAYHSYDYLISKLAGSECRNIKIDELASFLPYKLSMTAEQVALIAEIENVRSHRNCLLSACRDINRINNNYRNGKVYITILLIERYKDPAFTEGVVLVGSPIMEVEDKFYMSLIRPTYNTDNLCAQLERLPSFAGYIYYDDIFKRIPARIMSRYYEEKEKGIQIGTSNKLKTVQKAAKRKGFADEKED